MANPQELFLEIYIAMLCINGGILIVDNLVDTPLKTPFDTAGNVTGITSGPVTRIYNSTNTTGTLVGNLSSGSLENSTIGGLAGLLAPIDFVFQPLAFLWVFIQFLFGNPLFDNLITLLGFPSIFIFVMQAVMGILLGRIILYYWIGR